MNRPSAILLLLASYLAVFLSAWCTGLRNRVGAQIDLLPGVMVYCGLTTSLGVLTTVAVFAGLWFDSLSANPLGVSILPLWTVGVTVHWIRELILRDQVSAQFVLGFLASGIVPVATVGILLGTGYRPLLGWGSLWQWLYLTVTGAALTPVSFWVLDRLSVAINYRQAPETSFRPDREIKRGRD